MSTLAVSFSVSGLHGWLQLIAAVLFAIAAVIAWFTSPRAHWAAFTAAGLCLAALSMLITGLGRLP
jgi:hypothetical protein